MKGEKLRKKNDPELILSNRLTFKEFNEDHDKVDVKVDHIQKVETSIRAVEKRKAKSKTAHAHSEPETVHLFKVHSSQLVAVMGTNSLM